MNIMLLKEILRNIVFFAYGTDVADSRLRRLFHDIPKLSRKLKPALTAHSIHFNLQGIAAHAGPRQPAYNAHFILSLAQAVIVTLRAEIFIQISL